MKNSHHNPQALYYLKEVGQKLSDVRKKRNEKIMSVAMSIGVSHSVISKIENGRYPGLSMQMLVQIASYYNIPLAEVFSATENDSL